MCRTESVTSSAAASSRLAQIDREVDRSADDDFVRRSKLTRRATPLIHRHASRLDTEFHPELARHEILTRDSCTFESMSAYPCYVANVTLGLVTLSLSPAARYRSRSAGHESQSRAFCQLRGFVTTMPSSESTPQLRKKFPTFGPSGRPASMR